MSVNPLRASALFCVWALAAVSCVEGPGAATGSCEGHEVSLGAEGVLVVGVDLSSAPFAFREGGEPTGFDVDLLRAVGERLGLEVAFENRGFASIVPGLLANAYDAAASGLLDEGDPIGQACLTEPYLDADPVVVVRGGDAEAVSGPDDLAGRTVVVQDGTPWAAWADETLSGASVRRTPTPTDPFDALRRQEADAVVAPRPVALWRATTDDALAVGFESDGGGGYVFAVAPGNGALKDAVDDGLAALRDDGTYDELYERWFGRSPA